MPRENDKFQLLGEGDGDEEELAAMTAPPRTDSSIAFPAAEASRATPSNRGRAELRMYWKTVLFAVVLFLGGAGLLIAGALLAALSSPKQSIVFFVIGALAFLPGLYYIFFTVQAARGARGYSMSQIAIAGRL